jgi:hypothetical protein
MADQLAKLPVNEAVEQFGVLDLYQLASCERGGKSLIQFLGMVDGSSQLKFLAAKDKGALLGLFHGSVATEFVKFLCEQIGAGIPKAARLADLLATRSGSDADSPLVFPFQQG